MPDTSTVPKRIYAIPREATTPADAEVVVLDGPDGLGKLTWANLKAAIAAAYSADPATFKLAALDGSLKISPTLLPTAVAGSLVFIGGIAGNSVPATAGAPGQFYVITSGGTSQSKTWLAKDFAIYNGSTGSWTQLSEGVTQTDKGGTGATSPAGARTNLQLMSQQETDSRIGWNHGGLKWNAIGSERVVSALTGQTIGTGNFALRLVLSLPATIQGTDGLCHVNSTNGGGSAIANGLWILAAGATLSFRLYGATSADYREKSFPITWGDKTVELLFVRDTVAGSLTLYVDGIAATPSGETTGGTPPTWAGTLTATYFQVGSAFNPSEATYRAASMFNFAPTAADALELYLHGIATKWKWGSQAELITTQANRDFSGANAWTNGATTPLASFDATGDLSISSTASGQNCRLDGSAFGGPSPMKAYEISFDAANVTGAAFNIRFENQGAFIPVSNQLAIVPGRNSFNAIPQGNAGTLGIEIVASGTGAVDLDNFNMKRVGAFIDLDFTVGVGFQTPDRSTNKLHGEITNVGIEHRIPRWEGHCLSRAITGNSRVLPLALYDLPAGALITSIFIRNTTANAITGLTIGTTIVSGSSDVVASVGILANESKFLTVAGPAVAAAANQWLYVTATGWNSASVLITVRYVIAA